MRLRLGLFISALAGASLACQTVLGVWTPTPAPPPVAVATTAPRPSRTPAPTEAPAEPTLEIALTVAPAPSAPPDVTVDGVRQCSYVPGVSVPAVMPPEVLAAATPTPYPTATPPAPTVVDDETTGRQLRVYEELWTTVRDYYVYADYRGRDWNAIGDQYEAIIRAGLTDEDFYLLMQLMLNELGDEHSSFQSPEQVAEEEAELAGQNDYVGVGILVSAVLEANYAVIIAVFPDSPAAEAGLRSHDIILQVDGGPILDEDGVLQSSRIRGPEGTRVQLTVERPGETAQVLDLPRRRITGALPIDYCLVPGTRIGYVFFPSFFDETIPDQVRAALRQMTAAGPLDGLILDNRQNGGGSQTVADPIMGLFTSGLQGQFVSREDRVPLRVEPEDVGGSQSVPLVVLVGDGTASYGEIVSGVLRVSGRAQIVGQTTYGNVERLWGYDFEDGSRAWIASETFQPRGQTNGIWEETGIIPDVFAPSRWDLFSEASDPALAAAVDLLQNVR